MSRYDSMFQILRDEYGIFNKHDLDIAVKNLGSLDITRFCIKGNDYERMATEQFKENEEV